MYTFTFTILYVDLLLIHFDTGEADHTVIS